MILTNQFYVCLFVCLFVFMDQSLDQTALNFLVRDRAELEPVPRAVHAMSARARALQFMCHLVVDRWDMY